MKNPFSSANQKTFGLLLFFFLILISQKGFGQQDSVSYGFLHLKDETTLSGKIISSDGKSVTIKDFNLGNLTVQREQIVEMEILKNGSSYRFTMVNGQIYSGSIVNQTDSSIDVSTLSIGVIHIVPNQIKSVLNLAGQTVVDGKLWFPNPHGTRYLFMPSAIPLKKGEGYYQNIYIDINSVTYGLSDHVSVGIGFAVPLAYMATIRAGYKVGKNLHVGGGAIYTGSFLGTNFGFGAVFANATYGNSNANVTVAGGYGFYKTSHYNGGVYSREWVSTNYPLATVSGMYRVANRFALISENWFFPITQRRYDTSTYPYTYTTKTIYDQVLSFGFRTMWERSSFDLAIATEVHYLINNGGLPAFPYLDYVLKF